MASHTFAQIPKAEIQRSSFDRSHGVKTTINSGYLIPCFVDEALPGDTFNLKMDAIARLATPIFPIMDNIYIDTFFFAVPCRLLWDNWEKFNGQQTNPTDSTDYTIPKLNPFTGVNGTLTDYFGLPVGVPISVSALPFRAYNLIWNEWFRDQNLQESAAVNTSDTGGDPNQYGMRRRGKRHDYFTSCLPWPQKGDPVDIPLGVSAPVVSNINYGGTGVPYFKTPAGPLQSLQGHTTQADHAFVSPNSTEIGDLQWGINYGLGKTPNLVADLTSATAATINSLRAAFQVQRLLERDARGGTRYTEIIKSHFGVTSPDARLQRPEYLGGFSQPINISQIHQTQRSDTGGTPLGQVGAIGTGVISGNRNGFTSSFTEHCYIIGLVNVRAELTYQQQINRMWSRSTRFDFFWPALAHIGEQPVLTKEIFCDGTPGNDDKVFGFQERYGEYRYKQSLVTGQMRSNFAQSLDAWHLALDYATAPVLNATFIEDNPPIDRVLAVSTDPQIILDCWFTLRCARPMPMYGVPGLIDHF